MPQASRSGLVPGLQEALALGLSEQEYALICERHGSAPNLLELSMYSLLWSEHCSYKHSRRLLATLPTEGPSVVLGPGENAGALDIGDGLVCAFKVESHNHPSAVEPFEGAATGVGGILRDIFALGARPVAVLDSLRLGDPAHQRTAYLLSGVVSGIAHYGNCVGVPTVGGEVYFEGAYNESCLVNVMALGIAPRARLIRSAASGEGNLIVLFGAATGRDGIGGASVLASAELSDQAGAQRPTVQVGDPFEGKKLLECSLELVRSGLLIGLQDLGAAGLTSAVAEMASKGHVGVQIDVSAVPLRQDDLQPHEIMVSESQERMLCVVAEEHLPQVLAICRRHEVQGAAIGLVTGSGRVQVLRGQELLGEMPVAALVEDVPRYQLHPQAPAFPLYPSPPATLSPQATPSETLLALLRCPNIASRLPIFERYDQIVQSRTVRPPQSADAAVLAINPLGSDAKEGEKGGERGTGKDAEKGAANDGAKDGAGRAESPLRGIAVSIDGNGRRVAADPYQGTLQVVLECASNLACVGSEPLGATNNLNFGNPEKPHIAWQLTESVRGLRDACEALQLPIVGGNVSLYNESPSGPIHPTPVVGLVGLVDDVRGVCGLRFRREGDAIALLGRFQPSLHASELQKLWGQPLPSGLPQTPLQEVIASIEAVREAVRSQRLSSAHDIAEGGLAIALAECCLAGGLGASVTVPEELDEQSLQALFGEGSGGFIVSGEQCEIEELGARIPLALLGAVGGSTLRIAHRQHVIELSLAQLQEAHGALRELLS